MFFFPGDFSIWNGPVTSSSGQISISPAEIPITSRVSTIQGGGAGVRNHPPYSQGFTYKVVAPGQKKGGLQSNFELWIVHPHFQP